MLNRTVRSVVGTVQQARAVSSTSSSPPFRRPYVPRSRTPAASASTPTSPASAPAAVKPTPVAPAQAVGTSLSTAAADAPTSSSAIASESTTPDALPSNDTFASYAQASASPSEPNPSQPTEIDWSTSFHGMSSTPFTSTQADILMRPLEAHEVEIKPDGLLYLPEILYRRILNKAFGPGGWGMVPRGEMTVMKGMVTREWGLIAGGRLVSVARGEQTFFDPSGMPTATEGCKSNALMRCCKDLGIASELWDPSFIRAYKAKHCTEAWTEHVTTKRKQKRWRKNGNKFDYPYTEAR
ncbi:Mgm101p [Sporobolomyces koalae]|uniref:Mgm101p n=1 Tax=Sporobolomyces koalae TaxID=500713 RepID=UPI00317C2F94